MGLLNYTYADIIKKIKKLGFRFLRDGKGSHELWYSDESDITVLIANHGGKTIATGTVKSIINQLGMTTKEFHNL